MYFIMARLGHGFCSGQAGTGGLAGFALTAWNPPSVTFHSTHTSLNPAQSAATAEKDGWGVAAGG